MIIKAGVTITPNQGTTKITPKTTLEIILETAPIAIPILGAIQETDNGKTGKTEIRKTPTTKGISHHGETMGNRNNTPETGTRETGLTCTNAKVAGQFMS